LNISSQVLGRAGARRAEADLARIGAAQRHQVLHRPGRLVLVADQQVGRDADQHDRREVAVGVVVHLRKQRRGDRMAVDVRHHQRRAVGRLLGGVVGGDHAGGAGPVLHDDLRLPHLAELLADHAGQDVGAAAGRKADHDANRPARQGLGLDHGCGHQCRRADGESPTLNHLSVSGLLL
jgi:hypothetical protein